MNSWIFLAIVAVTIVADVVWILYFEAIRERRALLASIWAMIIALCSIFNIVEYVSNKLYIIAVVIGTFIGTFLTITFMKRNDNSGAAK